MRMYEYLSRYGHSSVGQERVSHEFPAYKRYLLGVLSKMGRGRKILDIGCREGQFSRVLMDQCHEVWGIEIDRIAAQSASEQGISVKIANIEEGIPFEDDSFDLIHAEDIVEHIFDTKSFFLECQRVLKKDGILIFTVPNLNSLENRIRVLKGDYLANLGAYPEDHFGQHIRVFNQDKVRELCLQTGFEVDEIRGVFFLSAATDSRSSKVLENSANLAARFVPGLSRTLVVKVRRADER